MSWNWNLINWWFIGALMLAVVLIGLFASMMGEDDGPFSLAVISGFFASILFIVLMGTGLIGL